MSRRAIAALTLVVATSSLGACADAATAPTRSTLAPASTPAREAGDPTTCRGGWISSTGRCE